jgi:hypothetical protein
MFRFTTVAVVASALGALALAPASLAAPPAPEDLNPPPADFLTCKPTGSGKICYGSFEEIKVAEPQGELVCGSGASAFVIHDNAHLFARVTRWYDADGNLTRRAIHERAVPGDLDSATETTVGSNMITDPITHRKVLTNAGRTVFGADGSVDASGQQPFVDAFVDGDMSVFDDVCAALA